MRRIDVLVLGLGIFLGGGVVFLALQGLGLDGIQAGIWSQVVMVAGLLAWLSTYLFRVVTGKMTFIQQRLQYREAYDAFTTEALQRKFDALSPEEQERLLRETGQLPEAPQGEA
jgi:hypothetical protein